MVGTIIGALVTSGPMYLALRKGRKLQEAESTPHAIREHEMTREAIKDALTAVVAPLSGRLDEMHATMNDMREWQQDHATAHAIAAMHVSPLELRKGS
jgi:hypothetical protein